MKYFVIGLVLLNIAVSSHADDRKEKARKALDQLIIDVEKICAKDQWKFCTTDLSPVNQTKTTIKK